MMRPGGALALVVALVAGGGAAAQAVRADPPRRLPAAAAQRTVPVTAADLACPAPLVSSTSATTVTAVSAAGWPGQASAPGRLVLAPLRPGVGTASKPAAGELEAQRSGTLLLSPARAGDSAQVASATGALAAGIAAGALSRSTSGLEPLHGGGSVRGIGVAACDAAQTSTWFVGGGAGVGRSAELELTAPGQGGADVDVQVWGPHGRVDGDALHDVVVPPQAQRTLRLDALAPAARYAVHVIARSGRVAAALRSTEAQGLQPLGWDWVPEALAPARRLVVPGVLGGTGARTLRLAAPGDRGAVVSVTVLGPGGITEPDKLAALVVPAGSVVDVDLAGAVVAAGPSALELESTAPVTAGVLAREGAAAGRGAAPGELAWTAATPELRAGARAVLPVVATGVGRSADLVVTAPLGSARIRVTPLAQAGGRAAASRTLEIPSAHTVRVPLAAGAGTTAYAVLVEVLPGSSGIAAAGVLAEAAKDGPMVTTLPLRATVSRVTVPRVSEAPGMPVVR